MVHQGETISARLKTAREARGLTRNQARNALGYSFDTYVATETGERLPMAVELPAIALWLIDGHPQPRHEARGERLRAAIRRSGLTQQEIADKLGISQAYIARMNTGDRSGNGQMEQLSALLGVHERWLRFGDQDVRPAWATTTILIERPVRLDGFLETLALLRERLALERSERRDPSPDAPSVDPCAPAHAGDLSPAATP
jgi:transcriptional regulator with XRE-family HTH domain